MKKLVLLFLLVSIGLLTGAEFKVSRELERDELTVIKSNERDADGVFCAKVQISSDIAGLEFDSNRKPIKIEREKGKYFVYLSPGERYLVFRKAGFAELEYKFPMTLHSNTFYKMTVVKSGYGSADEGLVTLTFELNEKDVYISKGDNPPLLTKQKSAQYRLLPGNYSFRFFKDGFAEVVKELEINADDLVTINLEAGENFRRLKLPGVVSINSKPDKAKVFLNDQKMGITFWQDQLIAGSYKLTLKANMHHSKAQEFTLLEGQTLELPLIELLPRYGFWEISSKFPDAEIYLDGKFISKWKISRQRIESGSHLLTAKLDAYHDFELDFEIADGDDEKFEVTFNPAFGQLEIDSTPVKGAAVYINDEFVGVTPYRDERRLSDQYRVRIEKKLYIGSEETITVKDNELVEKKLMLNANFGSLSVNAPGSEIFLNDKLVSSNKYNADLVAGNYKIEARRDKYRSDKKELYLRVGAEEEYDLEPDPIQGAVTILSEPSDSQGAVIWVNGKKEKKTTPAVLPLLIGDYQIKLAHPKYLDQIQEVSLTEGDQKKLVFKLETYQGSMLSKRNKWKRNSILGLSTAILAASAGYYFNVEGDGFASDYQNTTNTEGVIDNWDKVESNYQNRDNCYYISAVPLVYTIYSWIKMGSYGRKLGE